MKINSQNLMMVAALVALAYALQQTFKKNAKATSAPPRPTVAGYDMGGENFGVTGDSWE